ncbi:unnamed protein product [Spodoptera exigua]|nr:unnamed protein product [Spodoptera exigua]
MLSVIIDEVYLVLRHSWLLMTGTSTSCSVQDTLPSSVRVPQPDATAFTPTYKFLLLVGKQIGLIVSEIGTLSFNRSKAMSLSKLVRVNLLAMARSTNRVSGRLVALQRLCSPNVTLIMNHMNPLTQ